HLHLSVTWLELCEHGQAAESEGCKNHRISGAIQYQRLARPEESRALRELPRISVWQPQRGRAAARGLPWADEGHHRPDRRSGRKRTGGVARQLLVYLRRQLEDADGERLRRLPRQHRALELRGNDGPSKSRRHQGGGCQQLEQVGGRRVWVRPRSYPVVDQDDEPRST